MRHTSHDLVMKSDMIIYIMTRVARSYVASALEWSYVPGALVWLSVANAKCQTHNKSTTT